MNEIKTGIFTIDNNNNSNNIYTCGTCGNHLTSYNELISKAII